MGGRGDGLKTNHRGGGGLQGFTAFNTFGCKAKEKRLSGVAACCLPSPHCPCCSETAGSGEEEKTRANRRPCQEQTLRGSSRSRELLFSTVLPISIPVCLSPEFVLSP
eukprot:Hpha_TRINITY_DN14197_c0_g1::TRINITY_DN14197_c0_g1_i1::g.10841::m.10841